MMRSHLLLLIGLASPFVTGLAQSPVTPRGWRLAPDAAVSTSARVDSIVGGTIAFTAMAPGWHATVGTGSLFFHEDARLWGRFELQSRLILFPNSGDAEYGLFVGGADLAGATARWTAFVLRRDGSASVLRHEGGRTTAVMPWTPFAAVKPAGATPVTNVMRIVADTAIHFIVNDSTLARLSRSQAPVDGAYGFRIGASMNLHITTLDATNRLAPVPPPR